MFMKHIVLGLLRVHSWLQILNIVYRSTCLIRLNCCVIFYLMLLGLGKGSCISKILSNSGPSSVLFLSCFQIELYNSLVEQEGTDGKKDTMKAYRAAHEENKQDSETDEDDKVSSALIDRVSLGILSVIPQTIT